MNEIPVNYGTLDYPDIAFVEDTVLISYAVTEMKPICEWTDETQIIGERWTYGKIIGAPVEWLYK